MATKKTTKKTGEKLTPEDLILHELEDLLALIGVKADVSIEQNESYYNVTVDSDDNALLIGRYGDTLSSLEHILSLLVAQKNGEFVPLTLEIGGYRQEREVYLKDLASRVREEVLSSGREKILSDLKPWERRVIHMYLIEDGDVTSESEGEGRNRVLVVRKK